MSRFAAWLRSQDGRWLLIVLVLALVVRLAVAGAVRPDPRDGRFDDSVFYDAAARHLADGDGYVFDARVWRAPDGNRIYPDQPETTPTALWPPGYPLVLSAVYAVSDDSVAAGRMANVLFGALTVAFIYLIALRLFGRAAAICAGFALALMPSHVLFTSILLSETFYGFLLSGLLAWCVYFVLGRERPMLPAIAAAGVLTAAAGMVRGEALAFGGVIALLMLYEWRMKAVAPLAVFAAGALLIVGPWTLRNQLTMGEAIAGTTGSGRVAYQGHNPDSDGGPSLNAVFQLEADILKEHPGIGLKELELRSREEGSRRAREWAWDHKLDELELVGRRMHLLFRSDEAGVTWLQSNRPWFAPENADRLINLSTAYFWGLAALALASAPIWFRARDARGLLVFAVVPYYILVFGVLFIGDPRYHYALYVPMAILGGVGIAALGRITAAQWREAFGGRTLGSVLRTYGTPER
jgi:4-amino-4-deoxy-L-arabinose transferase-like glycosyltransferase